MAEVASGIDALYLSGRAVVPLKLVGQLDSLREQAASVGDVGVDIGGHVFIVQPHGFGKYRYCLDHRHGRVGITTSRSLPAIRVQPRAEFLHGVRALSTFQWFDDVLSAECGLVLWSVSRLDLFSDWQGWGIGGEDRHRFACRADSLATHEEHRELTGLEFGRRTSHTVCARIYNKSLQAAQSGGGYWPQIWGDRLVGDAPVMRVEFEFGREGLRQFGIDTPEQSIEAAGALWSYATGTWLTLRQGTADATRSRWPLDPSWERIQRSAMATEVCGVDRMYQGRRAGTLERLTPALIGYVTSFAVLTGSVGIDDTVGELGQFLLATDGAGTRSFASRVEDKRRKLVWL